MTTNDRDDGILGEATIQWDKQGQTQAGLTDIYVAAPPLALHHGVPPPGLVHRLPRL